MQASFSHILSMIPEILTVCSKDGFVAGLGYFSSVLSYLVFIENTCMPNAVEICMHAGMASHGASNPVIIRSGGRARTDPQKAKNNMINFVCIMVI